MERLRSRTTAVPSGWGVMLAVMAAAGGCAHHQSPNSYAYSPPYAPPVYPQPQSAIQPVGVPPAAGTLPAATGGVLPGNVVQGSVVPGTVVPGPVVSGIAAPPAAVQGVPPCPQIPGATLISSSDSGGTVVAAGQTTPCPQAP